MGKRLRAENRFHLERVSLLSGPFEVLATAAAPRVLVSAEAVPYRPNRGVYVIVEEPVPEGPPARPRQRRHRRPLSDLLEMDGVAGVWVFGCGGPQRITVCFVDGDVAEVSTRMRSWPVGEHWESEWISDSSGRRLRDHHAVGVGLVRHRRQPAESLPP